MKKYLLLASLFVVNVANARSLTCELKDSRNTTNASRISVNLEQSLQDVYSSATALDIDDENYTFDLQIERNGDRLGINATIYENNFLQDELRNTGTDISLSKTTPNQSVLSDEVYQEDRLVLNLNCTVN